MNKETLDTLMTVGSMALFIGGPTTIAAGLATRLAVRGGLMLGRRLMAGAVPGAVATTAAFIHMSASGDGTVTVGHTIEKSELKTKQMTFTYTENQGKGYFEFGDDTSELSVKIVEELIAKAVDYGETKKIRVIDEGNQSARNLARVRNFTESSGLHFTVQEEPKNEDSNE